MHAVFSDYGSDSGHFLAGRSGRHQFVRHLDCEFPGDFTGAGTVYLRNAGTASAAVWPASYADDSAELYVLRRHLYNSDRTERRHQRIRTGSAVACLGNGPDQLQECRRYDFLQSASDIHHTGPFQGRPDDRRNRSSAGHRSGDVPAGGAGT